VIGDPIAHSASPGLHRAFLGAAELDGTYEAFVVQPGGVARAIETFRERGYSGLNVTTPLKEEAFACAQTHDAAARASGSVNTLVLGERIDGYSTDGIGVLAALAAAGLRQPSQAHVLVLGAGPTARAAVAALVSDRARVCVWNRTHERAAAVARTFDVALWRAGSRIDAVIAALPPAILLDDAELVAALQSAPVVIDVNYGARATLAASLGRADVHDGEAMLRAGARASFALFRRAIR